ncbi:methylmalonyl Co-A mutase-associated GTPase MeaB [Bacteroidota bacterium]
MMKNDKKNISALKVNKGIEQPPSVNPNSVISLKKRKKKRFTTDELYNGILKGDNTILGQAITIIESQLPEHQTIARELIAKCLPHSGKSKRIGITGIPGAGKSCFIEAIGKKITGMGHKLAVLAIDPSSAHSKGSILGDKTRMEKLSVDPLAFIRPSPSSGTLGGVASKTKETLLLCEAAGFNIIFIETIGVGQSETIVRSMVDFFLLLMIAGAGDELQGIKRGIMELADTVAITKADGSNILMAENAKIDYQKALHLFPSSESGWIPKVVTCSALKQTGLEELWKIIMEYFQFSYDNKYFETQRKDQARQWMVSTINDKLHQSFYNSKKVKKNIMVMEKKVMGGQISPYSAAEELLDEYFKNR